jgi:hypothetical protein
MEVGLGPNEGCSAKRKKHISRTTQIRFVLMFVGIWHWGGPQ